MVANQPEDWRKLCEAASPEQGPDKLLALVCEIDKAPNEPDRKRNGALPNEQGREPSSSAGESAA